MDFFVRNLIAVFKAQQTAMKTCQALLDSVNSPKIRLLRSSSIFTTRFTLLFSRRLPTDRRQPAGRLTNVC